MTRQQIFQMLADREISREVYKHYDIDYVVDILCPERDPKTKQIIFKPPVKKDDKQKPRLPNTPDGQMRYYLMQAGFTGEKLEAEILKAKEEMNKLLKAVGIRR